MSRRRPQLDNLLEPHQRGPRPVGAPAIVRHVGVWVRQQNHHEQAQFEKICFDVARALQKALASDHRFAPDRVVPFMPFEFIFGGAIATVVLARHYDYATATFILDLSKKPDRARTFVFDHPDADAEVAALEQGLRLLDADLTLARPGELKETQDRLFNRFWRRFEEILNLGLPTAPEHPTCEMFADFRGLLLVAGHEGRIKQLGAETSSFSLEDTARFDAAANKACFKRLGPLIRAAHPFARDIEFVVCNVMRRGALYVSALGNTGGQVARPGEPRFRSGPIEPLKYIIAVNGLQGTAALPFRRWPLGRLIFRLNELGALRLLAVREAHAIKAVGETAYSLGRRLDALFEQQTTSPELLEQSSGRGETVDRLRADLAKFFRDLNGVGHDIPAGGFSYRVSRSRFFAQQYRRLLPNLHVKRISAGLAYDQFVSGRVFGDFEEIDRIGLRVEALFSRANTLLSLVNAESRLAIQARQTDDLEIQKKQLVEQSTTLERIRHLQSTAEVLVVVGGAYYVGSMFKDLVAFVGPMLRVASWPEPVRPVGEAILAVRDGHAAMAIVYLVCLVSFGVAIKTLKMLAERKETRKRADASGGANS